MIQLFTRRKTLIGGVADIIPLDKIISEYKFEDDFLDTVGINNGSATGITFTNGLVGRAGVFNGILDNLVDLNTTSLIGGRNEFSLSLLLLRNSLVSNTSIYTSWSATVQEKSILVRMNATNIDFYLVTSSGQVGGTFFSISDVTNWHHLVFTYNGSTMRAYLDGVESGSSLSQNGIINNGGFENEKIGGSSLTLELVGNMDSVRIWQIALSQIEITELATKELSGVDINP